MLAAGRRLPFVLRPLELVEDAPDGAWGEAAAFEVAGQGGFLGAALAAVPDLQFELVVDDQDWSAEWLERGEVSAAVTASDVAVAGCTRYPLGALRYIATASPAFMKTWFADGVTAETLSAAPCMAFNARDGKNTWSYESDLPVVAGVTPTAGGVIMAGELTGDFTLLDSETGEKIYSYFTGGPIGGGISTYEVDGKQYVAVASGNASRTWTPNAEPASTVFIFGLNEQMAARGDTDG